VFSTPTEAAIGMCSRASAEINACFDFCPRVPAVKRKYPGTSFVGFAPEALKDEISVEK
jgi:hypothetical protein